MALVDMNFYSRYLGNGHHVSIILPDSPWGPREAVKPFYESGQKYKVLWLLHGTSGDHSDWVRYTQIETFATERDLIVVMPSGLDANYENWPTFATGFHMYDYLTEELMPMVHNWFPASDKKEDNYIAGLSMGGRGTFKYILGHPDKFAAGAVLSQSPRNFDELKWKDGYPTNYMGARAINMVNNAGGQEAFLASRENTWQKVIDMHEEGTLPKLFCCCGTKDSLYPQYKAFKKMCQDKGIPITFEEKKGYQHEWRFWNMMIERALEFFEIPKK